MTKQEFLDLTARGVVLLDGATGSNLRAAGMPVGVSSEKWILEHPEVMLDLQRRYVEAGSQILCTPTFSANRLRLKDFGLEEQLKELNLRLVELTREAAAGKALVAGDLPTLGRPLEPVGDMPYSEAYDIYREHMEALAEAGVDLFALETLMGADEAVAALDAAAALDLPVWCSFSAEADGSLMFGGNVWETAAMLQELGAVAVGVNCSMGPDQLESVIRSIRAAVEIPVIAKPNAGLPVMDEHGQAHYSMGPEDFARHIRTLIEAGAGIVGGCCGTTPEYIRQVAVGLGR
ncbi:MAG: homocysteine S-methyltransferase family protein [Oscillibacter sp.]|nr:homocysteine S-methyltransferase family protein [Oscillibacter sp.]